MFKLMIADDNPYILQELCNITDWENFDLHIVGTYANGSALLKDAVLDMPDVVLTDISMPIMDGISLASELRRLSSHVKIIFISSYADFEYAQKALSMKISGYILKPFKSRQLAEVMINVLQELRQESLINFEQNSSLRQAETFRRIALENYICGLLYHAKDDILVRTQLDELQFTLFPAYELRIVYVTFSAESETNESYSDTLNKVRFALQNYDQTEYRLILLPGDRMYFAILLISSNRSLDVANLLAQLSIDMEVMCGISTVMGYSKPSQSFHSVPDLYSQAHTAATQNTVTTPFLINYEDIQTEQIEQTEDGDSEFIVPDVVTSYIEKMRTYIEAHYMEQITTSDVAASVFLSPNYANQRFGEECGHSIFDHITQCRIKEAKRLLKETNEKVTTIAELVGYGSRINFYLAFKRNVGISPTEYKALKKQKERKR